MHLVMPLIPALCMQGPDNLKPAGRFKASLDLKQMCRRGIPAAYRPLVWQKISLSCHYRQRFPSSHYQTLLRDSVTALDKNVADDIEKDVDRLLNFELS